MGNCKKCPFSKIKIENTKLNHGYWIESWYEEEPTIKNGRLYQLRHKISTCSVCDITIVGLIDMYWCPNCGAKMDKKEGK